MKENCLLWYRVNLRVSQTMLNHNQNLFLIAFIAPFVCIGEFAKLFELLICIVQRVHFQVRIDVFNCQQILTKISFLVFCAEMLQQFPLTPKGCLLNIVCQFLCYSEILHSQKKIDKEF